MTSDPEESVRLQGYGEMTLRTAITTLMLLPPRERTDAAIFRVRDGVRLAQSEIAELASNWGIAPTAVAMLADHLMDPQGRALHRVQLEIRPDNAPSLAVAAKLGLREEGLRRAYLHIDGAWRDHRSFAVVTDELGPGGLRARLSHQHQASRARHTDQPAPP
mgnify:CR=1 FL=1